MEEDKPISDGVTMPTGSKPTNPLADIYKTMLHQLCARLGHSKPIYRVSKDGPDDAPTYTGFVLVDDVQYNDEGGNANHLDAEQSAAKVALMHLNKIDIMHYNISQLVHNGGLTKNMLLEYAHRMGYLMPSYETRKVKTPGALPYFVTTITCGEVKYDGPAMATKKEAEVNGATYACSMIMSNMSVNVETDIPQTNPTTEDQ